MDEVNEFCSLPPAPKNQKTAPCPFFRFRPEPLCVVGAAFETTLLAAHWPLWCPGVTVSWFRVCPSPCGGTNKNKNKKQGCGQKTPKKKKRRHFSFLFTESGRHIHPEGLNNSLIANCFFKETVDAPCEQLMANPSSQFCNDRCQWGSEILNNWHLCATEVHR